MKGKNLIMCGLCACIGFIGGEVRAYHKVLNELRTMERPKVTYMDYYDILGYETQSYAYLDYNAPVDAPQNLFGD